MPYTWFDRHGRPATRWMKRAAWRRRYRQRIAEGRCGNCGRKSDAAGVFAVCSKCLYSHRKNRLKNPEPPAQVRARRRRHYWKMLVYCVTCHRRLKDRCICSAKQGSVTTREPPLSPSDS